ncbi:MAG: putative lipid II flippase FtsW [Anaerolineae bacterium]|nr:putative lipid II flippase FtsW [Anaerolineae bacterium]
MADRPLEQPSFVDAEESTNYAVVAPPVPVRNVRSAPVARPAERQRRFIATLDPYLLIIVGCLLAVGLMMVYSTTFDWSYQTYGDESTIFLRHAGNMVIGVIVMLLLAFIDYRVWRRFAVLLLLVVIGLLIAVLIFGDDTFGARRSLIGGSLQPGEAAELGIVVYMAAWLSSLRAKIRSVTYGLIPFSILVGIVGGLVLFQPDVSTAGMIFLSSGVMFFLAGASLLQLFIAGSTAGGIGLMLLVSQRLGYASSRVETFLISVNDPTAAHYQVQQAMIAFINGGWLGVGLGNGRQKFGFLPAPHTDSIFAVIGEELGVIGATIVVLLYVAFAIRGFQMSRRSVDTFGSLLAAGVTVWVVSKALLNIAVMTALVPPTGAPLPFISFGGSSLVVLLAGTGLLISVGRVRARQGQSPERRSVVASYDGGRGNGRTHLSRSSSSRSARQKTSAE